MNTDRKKFSSTINHVQVTFDIPKEVLQQLQFFIKENSTPLMELGIRSIQYPGQTDIILEEQKKNLSNSHDVTQSSSTHSSPKAFPLDSPRTKRMKIDPPSIQQHYTPDLYPINGSNYYSSSNYKMKINGLHSSHQFYSTEMRRYENNPTLSYVPNTSFDESSTTSGGLLS